VGLNVDCSHLVDRKLLTAETKRQRDRCFYTVYLQDQLSLADREDGTMLTIDYGA
jgi:hypothetical protein